MAKPRNAAESKAAKAQANAARKAAARQRRAQLWQAFTLQRKEDKRLLPYMIGAFLLIVGASVGVGVWAGGFTMFTMIPLGVLLGALVAFVIFGRRAQRTVYRKAEGQTGAAAWALDNLRGEVAGDARGGRHRQPRRRAPGDRPARCHLRRRGSAARVKPLLAQEKKRTARLVGDVPIYDIIVGNGDGEFRWPSWSATSPAFRPTSRSSRWTRWSRDWRRWVRVPVRASCPRDRYPPRPRCAASSARSAVSNAAQRRTTAVAVSRSCSPRPSESVNSGGTTSPISRPRTTRRPIPTGRRPPTATTTRPSINCPGVN